MAATNTPGSPVGNDTQPVPKEGSDLGTLPNNQQGAGPTSSSSVDAQGRTVQPETPLAGSTQQQDMASQPSGAAMTQTPPGAEDQQQVSSPQAQVQPSSPPPQPPQVQKETVVVKKGGGCGLNKTTCCLGTGGGCILLIIIIILAAIFAAPTVSDLLNKALNAGINVPQIQEMSLETIESKIDTAKASTTDQTVTLSEDEFNALVRQKMQESTTEGEQQIDVRFDFEEDTANILIRFYEWMPWGVIEVLSDEEGNLTITSIKLGPIDVSTQVQTSLEQYQQDLPTNVEQPDQIDAASLLSSLLFDAEDGKVQITSVYLHKDQIEFTVKGSSS